MKVNGFFNGLEYFILRLLRKFIFNDNLLFRMRNIIPHYLPSQNEFSPEPIVEKYSYYLNKKGIALNNKNILEIGIGSTNSVGFQFVASHSINMYVGYEPFAPLDNNLNEKIKKQIINKYNINETLFNKTKRVNDLDNNFNNYFDVILSNSVLEHVSETKTLIDDLKRVLKNDGVMLHIVDYRDHFFKYPFHFLKYSQKVWDKYLNPGDLPRTRINEHKILFESNGFNFEIIEKENNYTQFNEIKSKINQYYKNMSDEDLSTTYGVLFITKK